MAQKVHPSPGSAQELRKARDGLAFCLAMVLKKGQKVDSSSFDLHRQSVLSLLAQGLSVGILESTDTTEDKIILLVDCVSFELGSMENPNQKAAAPIPLRKSSGKHLLLSEHNKLKTDMFEIYTALRSEAHLHTTDNTQKSYQLTPAEEIWLTMRIVQRALNNINCDAHGKLHEFDLFAGVEHSTPLEDLIEEVFPLHDLEHNKEFMESLSSSGWMDGTLAEKGAGWLPWIKYVWRSWIVQSKQDMDTDTLRAHFGDQMAAYFEFLLHYRDWLATLTVIATVNYLFLRFASWDTYLVTAFLLGTYICCYWGPRMLRFWSEDFFNLGRLHRKSEILRPVSEMKNPFLTRKQQESPEERFKRRTQIGLVTAGVTVINILVLVPISLLFTQWWVFGRMSPTCECCEFFKSSGIGDGQRTMKEVPKSEWPEECYLEYVNRTNFFPLNLDHIPEECAVWSTCFIQSASTVGTDRWVYILVQGIAMGLILDVLQTALFKIFTVWLTKLEGHETIASFQQHLIRKQFFFIWLNMFFWYLTITFLYVPFGERIQNWLILQGYGVLVPPWGFRPGKVELDEAFVTPMVATALINFLIDTFVPSMLAKLGLKAKHKHKQLKDALSREKEDVVHVAKYFGQTLADLVDHGEKLATHAIDMLPSPRNAQPEKDKAEEDKEEEDKEDQLVKAKQQQQSRGLFDKGSNNAHHSSITPAQKQRIMETLKKENKSASLQLFCDVAGALQHAPEAAQRLHFYDFTPDCNRYDAEEVVEQSILPRYDENDEYLTIVIQLGYISLFSSAWGLLPLAAFIRMVFAFRASCYRVMFACKRSLPLGVPNAPNAWHSTIYVTFLLAIPCICFMFTIATGGLDAILRLGAQAERLCQKMEERMSANIECSAWGISDRGVAAVILEHILFGLFAAVFLQTDFFLLTKRNSRLAQSSRGITAGRRRAKIANEKAENGSGSGLLSPAYVDALDRHFHKVVGDQRDCLDYSGFKTLVEEWLHETSLKRFHRPIRDQETRDVWFFLCRLHHQLNHEPDTPMSDQNFSINRKGLILVMEHAVKNPFLEPYLREKDGALFN